REVLRRIALQGSTMTNNTLSPIQDTQTQEDEIIRQRQLETCARLEAELANPLNIQLIPIEMKPGLFALEAFLASCPRRLKSRKNRPPG
ncbi:hypothetical protein AL597_RS22895, partial [Escherichia coli]